MGSLYAAGVECSLFERRLLQYGCSITDLLSLSA